MKNPVYRNVLGYFDSSTGVNMVVQKLPYHLQNKWTQRAVKYMRENKVAYPPFSVFVEFVHEMSSMLNNPSFVYEDRASRNSRNTGDQAQTRNSRNSVGQMRQGRDVGQGPAYRRVLVNKTGVAQPTEVRNETVCPMHGTNHSLNECRAFKSKEFDERKRFVKENGICFKCCESSDHKARDCQNASKCSECNGNHPTALHRARVSSEMPQVPASHGGEKRQFKPNANAHVESRCTQICGPGFSGKSCAKMVLVKVYHKAQPLKFVKTYAIIDDQSNRTLAKSDLFDALGLKCNTVEYSLNSCSGCTVSNGRLAEDCVVEALNEDRSYEIPSLLECDNIPNNREEIPTPEVAAYHPHLRDIAEKIPPIDEGADILLLIGRDLIDVHYVHDQRCGGSNSPYAQKLGLGWVVIGESCLGRIHRSNKVNVNKIHLLQNGRASVLSPCQNEFEVSEELRDVRSAEDRVPDPIFRKTKDDEKPGLSIDDREFLQTMENGFVKDSSGNWTAP